MKSIYLDHAATTYMRDEVKEAMNPYFSDNFANPGSLHSAGLKAKAGLINARETIAKTINCKTEEIIFTSGGTESINLAIKSVASQKGKGHIITSKIEHPAVLRTCEFLETQGFSVTYLDVDETGLINPEDVEKAITKDTILNTIMYANNEIGTIEPVKEIARIAKKHGILIHTDACQAANLDVDVESLGIDMMTLNGSKIYGPKGIGLLYKKSNLKINPLMHGGGQESGLRSGTENVPSIIGFAKALELLQKDKAVENARLIELRDYLINETLKKIPKSFVNGPLKERLPNNANISFLDVEGESVLLYLNEKGIFVSTGSACSSKKLEVSHVLDAIGLNHDAAHGSIRFSLGKRTTKEDIDYVLEVLPKIIESLRILSPVIVKEEDIRK